MNQKNADRRQNWRVNMDILVEISENLQKGKAKVVKELVGQAVEQGIPAKEVLERAFLPAWM